MSELDFSQAFARLKVENDYMCERNLNVSPWDCKKCPYLYRGGDRGLVTRCLLKEIRDWTLYRIEVEHG